MESFEQKIQEANSAINTSKEKISVLKASIAPELEAQELNIKDNKKFMENTLLEEFDKYDYELMRDPSKAKYFYAALQENILNRTTFAAMLTNLINIPYVSYSSEYLTTHWIQHKDSKLIFNAKLSVRKNSTDQMLEKIIERMEPIFLAQFANHDETFISLNQNAVYFEYDEGTLRHIIRYNPDNETYYLVADEFTNPPTKIITDEMPLFELLSYIRENLYYSTRW